MAVLLAVTFFTFGQTRIYEASSVILFDPTNPQPFGNQLQTVVDTGGQYWNNKEYYKTQMWIVSSEPIAEAVVRQLNLNKDPTFLDQVPKDARRLPKEVTVHAAAKLLLLNLSVEAIKDSRLAEVKYRDADPDRAQRVLSVLVDTFVQNNLDELTSASSTAADWLRNQLSSLGKELEDSELALHQYKKDKNILYLSLDDQANMLRTELEQLNTALTAVRAKREQIASRRDELVKATADDPANLPVAELLENGTIQQLRNEYVNAASELDALMASGKGANHPDVRAVASRKEAIRSALVSQIGNLKGAIEGDLEAIGREEQGLTKLVAGAQQDALGLNLLEIEYNRLRRAKENNEKLFSLVMERSKESDLTKMLRINNIRVVERPAHPTKPVSPNVLLNLVGGFAAALVLGCGVAIGREQLDRSIKTPDDAEKVLTLPFLGLLPSVQGAGAANQRAARRKRHASTESGDGDLRHVELVVHDKPTSGIAEAARAIRTNVMFMSPDQPYRVLLVTSAGPAEGKTTVACCFAIALAQAGRRVVLVDCDMRRPRLHRVFGKERDIGITTAILEATPSVDRIAQPTDVPNLSLVTTGPLPPNPAEILHSAAFMKLLDALRSSFDFVVIDSPPIVPVTDAAVLAATVDATILVVRAFQTSKDMGRRAVRALRDVGGRIVGTVLNSVDLERHAYGYQYYYYYNRDGYAAEEPPSGQGGAGDGNGESRQAAPPS
jgi:capsular exopolysaccharide synthesis family protein